MSLFRGCEWSVSMIIIAFITLFSSSHGLGAKPNRFSLFPPETFGFQNVAVSNLGPRDEQLILDVDREHPRFSTPDFHGDETGGSPFFYCPESDPENDIFDISKIVLNPNPPHINYVFVFHAHGNFRESIIPSKGPFRAKCTVRNEDREGLDFTFEQEFCGFADLVEMDGKSAICPPFKGNGTIHKIEFVDFGISEANYSVKIDVTGNGKRVFCIQAWFDLVHTQFDEH